MPTAAVIGASRGIGLELARQYAQAGWRVHATTRTPDAPGVLGALPGDLHLHELDVRDGAGIARLAGELSGVAIDILIHNAGILNTRGRGTPEQVAEAMRVNAEAPIETASALIDNVAASDERKVALISSVQGVGRPRAGSPDVYGDSKGELNRRFREIEPEWRAKGVTAVALHPGYVRTDMTGRHASISPEESVSGIRRVMADLGPRDAGSFMDYRGEEIQWSGR